MNKDFIKKKENVLVDPTKGSNLDRFKNLSIIYPKPQETRVSISPSKLPKKPESKSDIPNIKIGSFNSNNFDSAKKDTLNGNLQGNSIINPFYFGHNNIPNNRNNNINSNNNNNLLLNPFFKSEDDQEQNEKSIDKELNALTSDTKSLRQLSRINNKDKHNLLKIVNMYMKDDKKAQSKLKISGLIKSSMKKKKNLYLIAAERQNKKSDKNKSELKLPIINDDDLSRSIISSPSNRLLSAKSNREKNKKSQNKKSNKYNVINTEYETNSNTSKYLKIPRIQNRRGNITLDDSSNYSNTKNDSQSKERSSKFKKKKSNNIINIVNNLNGNNDKNNNIGLKVNINRYDIKYYIPPKKKNNDKNNSGGANLNFSNDSSKSSHEIIINNSIGNSDYRSNDRDQNKNNGINVDIINYSRKGTKKIADNNKLNNGGKVRDKDDIATEKKLRRQILHKIKSMNNLYRTDMLYNRPKLDQDSFSSNDADNKPKVCFQRYMSKEIKYNTVKQDRKERFDILDLEDYFNEDGTNRSNRKNKNKNKDPNKNWDNNNNFYNNSQNSNSVLTKRISNVNTSVEKFELNFINKNSKNLNNILTDEQSDFLKNKDKDKKESDNIDSNLASNNSQNNLRNNSFTDEFGRQRRIKTGMKDLEDSSGGKGKLQKKRKKKIRKKGLNENGEEISFSFEVTDSQYNTDIDNDDDLDSSGVPKKKNRKSRKSTNDFNLENSIFSANRNPNMHINDYLYSLLEKLRKGENISPAEESYIIASGVLNEIIEEMLEKIFPPPTLISQASNSNLINNKSELNTSSMDDEFSKSNLSGDSLKNRSKLDNNSLSRSKDQNLADNEHNENSDNDDFENESINNSNNELKDKDSKLFFSPEAPEDELINKYNDDVFSDLGNKEFKWTHKRRNPTKPAKLQSQKLMHKILIDFINPKDLKQGLLRQKQFMRAFTLNPIKYKDFDELLVKKNLKLLYMNSSESEGEPLVKDIKTRDLTRRCYVLKNLNTLTKRNNKIRENWKNIFDNPNLEENTKLKFMDILSNKSHLKNKLEEMVLDHINNILTDDLNSDKNNKLSKKLIKLYREETYNLDVEKYDNEAKNAFPNPTIFNTKAKILQENKDYLISAYFDIYEDILNDIFNSGNSIFEFNEELKGSSILKNFQIRTKSERHQAFSKSGAQSDFLVNQIESLKNAYNARRVNLFTKESLSISDRLRMQFRDQSNFNSNSNNNNNNLNAFNTGSINNNYNVNHLESFDTRSNYDKLGLANQTYINNILLRDFSYKEKLHYIENTRSDKVSDINNTVLDNTSHVNDSISLSTHAAASSNIKRNTIFLKTNLIKFFKDPVKNIASGILSHGHSSNHIQDSGGNAELNGNFDDTFDDHTNKNSKRKNDSDEFNERKHNPDSENDSVGLREPVKKKKKRDGKKVKASKFNQSASSVINKKNDNNQSTSFFDLIKKQSHDPMFILKNVFDNKDDISILRNQEHCKNLVSIKNFSKIKLHKGDSDKTPSNNNLKNTEIDKTHILEKKKLMSSTPLTKENTLFKTLEIKSSQLQSFKDNTSEILKFYIKDGNFVKFKELFEKNKYLIDKFDENGDTLLNIAVKCNHYEIASYLLDHGADVNSQNKNLNAPLHYALSFKNFKIADLLLMKKADEELPNKKGYSPWQLLTLNENIDDM